MADPTPTPAPAGDWRDADGDLTALVARHLEGELGDDEVRALNARLSADPSARDLFVRLARLHGLLSERAVAVGGGAAGAPDDPAAGTLEPAATPGATAPAEPSATAPDAAGRPARDGRPAAAEPWRRRPWRLAAAILLPLLIGAAAFQVFRPRATPVVLEAAPGAEWDGPGAAPAPGRRLPAGPLSLRSGLAQLRWDSGATVIVEGPARFEVLDGNAVALHAGRLAANVPPAARGFTVRAGPARVVDLGTEFGVNFDGTSAEVEVFRGRVDVAPAAPAAGKSGGAPAPQRLAAGEAARVSAAAGVTIDPAGASPQRFVRSLAPPASSLDLADVLCGGDGTTGRRDLAVDAATGRAGALPPIGVITGRPGYHRIPSLPAVNGAFVPDKDSVVDSAGHHFTFRPTGRRTLSPIYAGGRVMPATLPGEEPGPPLPAWLGGVNYAAAGHSMLFMHANNAVTFDLAALRRLHPGAALSAFRATGGNCFPDRSRSPKADLFVLVDGQARYERLSFPRGERLDVRVALDERDRFLTLAVTDGGDGGNSDWALFGDPQLLISPALPASVGGGR